MKTKPFKCDICSKNIYISEKSKLELERDGWLVYCFECAEKLNIKRWEAKRDKIKIYKMINIVLDK